MKKYITFVFCAILLAASSFAQKATHDQVVSKQVKGQVTEYVAMDGTVITDSSILVLGLPAAPNGYVSILQNAQVATYPVPTSALGSEVKVKNIKIYNKTVYVNTTKGGSCSYGLLINNFEAALQSGEIMIKGHMTSNQALSELKKEKEKFDLGLITESEFLAKKEELSKYIK